jgi:ubiquinone/menaquinone biosynthesis C-methylase UbiE
VSANFNLRRTSIMTTSQDRTTQAPGPSSPGILLHAPRFYDFQVWLATRGRERALRETILRLARVTAGETMLDVGCGTGTLAMAAKRLVGPSGEVIAIDASPEMVGRARRKACAARLDIEFREAPAQALPFADGRFDLVTSTLMLHHLPRSDREASAREMARVLKSGGRALVVDFASSSKAQGGWLHQLHRHGRVRPADIIGLVNGAGMSVVESGPLGMRDLHFVLARAAGAGA